MWCNPSYHVRLWDSPLTLPKAFYSYKLLENMCSRWYIIFNIMASMLILGLTQCKQSWNLSFGFICCRYIQSHYRSVLNFSMKLEFWFREVCVGLICFPPVGDFFSSNHQVLSQYVDNVRGSFILIISGWKG